MPTNAMHDLSVTFCLRLAEIGPALDILARRGTTFETGLSASLRMLKERVALFKRLLLQSNRNIHTREFLISELDTLREDLLATQTLLNDVLATRGRGLA